MAPLRRRAAQLVRGVLGLEEAASLLRTYELQFVPGLLQTEDYARAVVRLGFSDAAADEIERRVRCARPARSGSTAPGAPTLWAVVDEAACAVPWADAT